MMSILKIGKFRKFNDDPHSDDLKFEFVISNHVLHPRHDAQRTAAVRDLGIDISTPFRQTFSVCSLTLSYRQWHTPKEEKPNMSIRLPFHLPHGFHFIDFLSISLAFASAVRISNVTFNKAKNPP